MEIVNKLPKNCKIIFKTIIGSRAYNLHTEKSDYDFKGVYIQTNDDILSGNYIPQVNETSDCTYFEIRRFFELVSTGNPNVLELLYVPHRCVLIEDPIWKSIKKEREFFLTKNCYITFVSYAKTQLRKAQGLNKKFNWEESRIERKNVIDFCKIVSRENGKTFPLKEWLKEEGYTQEQVGLTSIDGFRDCYKLYTDDIKWANEANHRFNDIDFSDRGYRGIIKDDSTNEPRKSIIEKYRINDWKGIVYWNREKYSTHCKEYREYEKWLKNRNEDRVATNKRHGQQYDSKNLLHVVRLIMTAQEIPTQNRINVDRTKERDYLLSIKKGEVDLKSIIEEWSIKAEELKELYDKSMLKDEIDLNIIRKFELKLRNYELPNN